MSLDLYNKHLEEMKVILRSSAMRWLQQINFLKHSKYYGISDRIYWSWKTKDFANGSLQAGLAGFLDFSSELPMNHAQITRVVDAITVGTKSIQRKNGSFEEAYPHENSYCVTGLVLFCLLYAYLRHPKFFSPTSYKILTHIVERSNNFISSNLENHGIIANHQATCQMALLLTKKFQKKQFSPENYLDPLKCLKHGTEHWFSEYGGADPGYQTLFNHYLCATYTIINNQTIGDLLKDSLTFLNHFCFPDGSYSAEVGCRGTQIVYPGGLWSARQSILSSTDMLSWFLSYHMQSTHCVNPLNVDSDNFIPVFNSWSFCYRMLKLNQISIKNWQYQITKKNILHLPAAELVICKSSQSMLILSAHNGAIRHVSFDATWQDHSLVYWNKKNQFTQYAPIKNFCIDKSALTWQYQSAQSHELVYSPIKSIIVRLLAILVKPFPMLNRLMKKLMLKYALSDKSPRATTIYGKIDLDSQSFHKIFDNPEDWTPVQYGFLKHMASANAFDMRALYNIYEQQPPALY